MKNLSFISITSKRYILFSLLSLASVSFMAFHAPQSVMDLVNVQLKNTDAYSSIKGIYGGAGLTICISLIFLYKNNIELALIFSMLLWGLYALSRTTTIFMEGPLGTFGNQWIEIVLFTIGLLLLVLNKFLAIK